MVVIIILSDQLLSVPTSSLLANKLNLRVHNFTYHKLVDCSEFSIEQETLFYMNNHCLNLWDNWYMTNECKICFALLTNFENYILSRPEYQQDQQSTTEQGFGACAAIGGNMKHFEKYIKITLKHSSPKVCWNNALWGAAIGGNEQIAKFALENGASNIALAVKRATEMKNTNILQLIESINGRYV